MPPSRKQFLTSSSSTEIIKIILGRNLFIFISKMVYSLDFDSSLFSIDFPTFDCNYRFTSNSLLSSSIFRVSLSLSLLASIFCFLFSLISREQLILNRTIKHWPFCIKIRILKCCISQDLNIRKYMAFRWTHLHITS